MPDAAGVYAGNPLVNILVVGEAIPRHGNLTVTLNFLLGRGYSQASLQGVRFGLLEGLGNV